MSGTPFLLAMNAEPFDFFLLPFDIVDIKVLSCLVFLLLLILIFWDLEGGMTLNAFPLYSLLNEIQIKIIFFHCWCKEEFKT